MSFKNSIFINDIQSFTKDEYLSVREKYISLMSSIHGINSIYTCGNIDTPGISDLDFLILTDSEGVDFNKIHEIHSSLSHKENYIIGNHYPYFVKKDIALNINYILPLTNLEHAWGENKYLNVELSNQDYFFILGEILINFYPIHFIKPLFEKKFYIRKEIVKLKSSRFIIYYSKKIGLKSDLFEHYLREVDFICKNYLNIDLNKLSKKIYYLNKLFIRVLSEIVEFMDNLIKTKYDLIFINTSNVHTNTIFKDLKCTSYINKTRILYKLTGKIVNFYPRTFGLFSYENKKILKLSDNKVKYVEDRLKLIEEHANYYKKNKMNEFIVYDAYHHLKTKNNLKKIFIKLLMYF